MGIIEDFIGRYRKEFDFYDQAGRLVAQILDSRLQAAGIRSMVTSRAKSVARLEAKVRQRYQSKQYATVDEVYSDIVDLAGVRVALYFPGERNQVDTIIKDLFSVVESPKDFSGSSAPAYQKRFSGYWATHYRVQLRETSLSDAQKRYAEAPVEIQVASVLMHAWAEVEHDLVYKPVQGELSNEEYAILDQLNGLVITGEIALEQLQKAGENRVAKTGRPFGNHYELAAHLVNRTGPILKGPLRDTALGRVDLLFDLLVELKKSTPEHLAPYLGALHEDTERRPIAEQIVDQLLTEDQSRYKLYESLRQSRQVVPAVRTMDEDLIDAEARDAMGHFLREWINFELFVREANLRRGHEDAQFVTGRMIQNLDFLAPQRNEIERIRRIRNNLVHGIEIPNPADLREAAARLRDMLKALERHDQQAD